MTLYFQYNVSATAPPSTTGIGGSTMMTTTSDVGAGRPTPPSDDGTFKLFVVKLITKMN